MRDPESNLDATDVWQFRSHCSIAVLHLALQLAFHTNDLNETSPLQLSSLCKEMLPWGPRDLSSTCDVLILYSASAGHKGMEWTWCLWVGFVYPDLSRLWVEMVTGALTKPISLRSTLETHHQGPVCWFNCDETIQTIWSALRTLVQADGSENFAC